ncbi:MAG: D-alanyl-D-alanine carboxypeptidase family protein [Eubacteriales bacterium]|nr:D-alanyl-D-alanine carboxypeptidase family protein [Eubacteriales bacterium]
MNRKLKQILSVLLACQLFTITAWAKPDWPSDTGIQAEAGIVMDVDSGAILFGQNIHVPYPPASITKILTALVVIENCQLDEMVEFTENACYNVEADSGNKLGSSVGDILSVEDCLYGLLLVSSNQAANALAEHTAGSISAFVDMMNQKLAELGCTESHFDNPSGLNGDTQYVSAHDMALIAQAAYQNEELLTISSAVSHQLAPTANYPGGLTITQEHRLLKPSDEFYYASAKAGKTGYLLAAGNTLVTYAEEDGRKLVSVILKGQPRQYFADTTELLSFGFRSFQNLEIAGQETRYVTGDEVLETERGSFKASDLAVEPGRAITLPHGAVFSDADLSLDALPASAPERAAALMTYSYNDRVVGTAYLMVKDGVALPEAEDNPAAPDQGASPEASPSDPPQESPSPSGSHLSAAAILPAVAVFLFAAAAAAAAAWIVYSRKKEAEELARRRERRRQRLQQAGEEEEFERMLAQWKEKEKKRR